MKSHQEALDNLLSNAVESGDIKGLKNALRNGADPKQYESANLIDATCFKPCHLPNSSPHMKSHQEALDNLLSIAVERGDLKGVEDALRKGADPKHYESADLIDATWMGHIEIAKLLIPLSDPAAFDQAMSEAGIHGHTELIEAMLPLCGADDAMNALRAAAYHGHRETVDFLYDKCDMDMAIEQLRKDEGKPTVDYLIARRQSELDVVKLQAQTSNAAGAWCPSAQQADAYAERMCAQTKSSAQEVPEQHRPRQRL